MTKWIKFDKNHANTWPPEGKKVFLYENEYRQYVGYGDNYNYSVNVDELRDNVICIPNPCNIKRVNKYENNFTHWRELPEPPEDL